MENKELREHLLKAGLTEDEILKAVGEEVEETEKEEKMSYEDMEKAFTGSKAEIATLKAELEKLKGSKKETVEKSQFENILKSFGDKMDETNELIKSIQDEKELIQEENDLLKSEVESLKTKVESPKYNPFTSMDVIEKSVKDNGVKDDTGVTNYSKTVNRQAIKMALIASASQETDKEFQKSLFNSISGLEANEELSDELVNYLEEKNPKIKITQ